MNGTATYNAKRKSLQCLGERSNQISSEIELRKGENGYRLCGEVRLDTFNNPYIFFGTQYNYALDTKFRALLQQNGSVMPDKDEYKWKESSRYFQFEVRSMNNLLVLVVHYPCLSASDT